MTALRIFLARLFGLFGSGTRRERELRAEIDGHIAEATDEYVRQGMTPEEARHSALRQFGGVTQTVEAHRDQRRFTFFSTLRQDLQYAVRTLSRAPGFAIIAVPQETATAVQKPSTAERAEHAESIGSGFSKGSQRPQRALR